MNQTWSFTVGKKRGAGGRGHIFTAFILKRWVSKSVKSVRDVNVWSRRVQRVGVVTAKALSLKVQCLMDKIRIRLVRYDSIQPFQLSFLS